VNTVTTQSGKIEHPASGLDMAWSLMRKELAPFPGRMEAVWRAVLASAIVIVIAMTLQVPFLAFSLIMVFFTAQENTVLTRQSGLLFIIGTTASLLLSILQYRLTIDYPLLRLLTTCAILFCGLYFMRISKWGSYGFVVALMVVNLQNLADVSDDPEWLTHSMLWFWLAACYPIVISVAVNYLLAPAHPSNLLRAELLRQLDDVMQQLEASRTQVPALPLSLDAIERGILTLHRHLSFAILGEEKYRRDKARHLMRVTTVDRLHTAAAQLSRLSALVPALALTSAQREFILRLLGECRNLRQAIENQQVFHASPNLVVNRLVDGKLSASLQEMAHAIHALGEAEQAPPVATSIVAGSLIAADAWNNPVYAQFALKTVMAAMLCYVLYTACQWRGIQTSMLTCLIMALPSVGAASHKGILRIVGCVLGSIAALLATVFVIPHLESLVGLLFLTLPVIGIGAWIAAGSARSGYIGVQFMFAYALASLGGYGPVIDLVEIRDRVIGILLGFIVSIVIFSTIWPEREGRGLRTLLAQLMRSIAKLARVGTTERDGIAKQSEIDSARLEGWSLLTRNREMQARVALEPGWQFARDSVDLELRTWFAQAQEALFAVNWLQTYLQHAGAGLPAPLQEAFGNFRENAAKRMERLANRLEDKPSDQADELQKSVTKFDELSQQAQENPEAAARVKEITEAVHAIHERIMQLSNELFAASIQPANEARTSQ
jgi:multidrug resistance protein MdtO